MWQNIAMEVQPEREPNNVERITFKDKALEFTRAAMLHAATLTPPAYLVETQLLSQPNAMRGAAIVGASAVLFGGIKTSLLDQNTEESETLDKNKHVEDTWSKYRWRRNLPDVKTIVENNMPVRAQVESSIQSKKGKTKTDITVFIEDTYIAAFTSQLVQKPNGKTQLNAWNLDIHEDYREEGLATRVTSALVHTAIEQGATRLDCTATSPHTLRIFRKLFKKKRIKILDQWADSSPVSLDEAINYLDEREDGREGFDFQVKLPRKADKYEKPIWVSEPPSPL